MTCPCCGSEFPFEAGLIEADAKRVAAIFADLEPPLARTAMAYLRLFKPAKSALRLTRAIKLLAELQELVAAGTVCRDERGGVRRPATQAVWVAAIEQMLTQSDRLTLPLGGHGYLREVAFGIADKADAVAEREREASLRAGPAGRQVAQSPVPVDRLANELAFLRQMRDYGQLDPAEYARREAETRQRFGQTNQEAA